MLPVGSFGRHREIQGLVGIRWGPKVSALLSGSGRMRTPTGARPRWSSLNRWEVNCMSSKSWACRTRRTPLVLRRKRNPGATGLTGSGLLNGPARQSEARPVRPIPPPLSDHPPPPAVPRRRLHEPDRGPRTPHPHGFAPFRGSGLPVGVRTGADLGAGHGGAAPHSDGARAGKGHGPREACKGCRSPAPDPPGSRERARKACEFRGPSPCRPSQGLMEVLRTHIAGPREGERP